MRKKIKTKQPYVVVRSGEYYTGGGKIFTPNGTREIARRRRQIQAGQLAYWKDDGNGYKMYHN